MLLPDPLNAIQQYLKSDPDVYGICGEQAYIDSIPKSLNAEMPTACVVIRPVGGGGSDLHGLANYRQRIQLRTYGKTTDESRALQRACIGALNRLEDSHLGDTARIYTAELATAIATDADLSPAFWNFFYTIWVVSCDLSCD